MVTKKPLIYLLVSFLVFPVSGYANTDERIKGVSEFLLDRFQENYLYIFEVRLRNNQYFKQYFPATYEYVKSGDLRFLLRSNSDIWEKTIEDDINKFGALYLKEYIKEKKVVARFRDALLKNEWATKNAEKFAKLRELIVKVKGRADEYTKLETELVGLRNEFAKVKSDLNKIKVDDSLSTAVQGIVDVAVKIEKLAAFLDKLIKSEDNGDIAYVTGFFDTIKEYMESLQELQEKITKVREIKHQLEIFFAERKRVIVDGEKKINLDSKIDEVETFLNNPVRKIEAEDLAKALNEKKKLLNEMPKNTLFVYSKKRSYAAEVFALEKIIKNLRELAGEDVLSKDYRRFRQYIFFFAQLADADSSSQVKALLVDVTLPAVSFGIKRERTEYQWLITSYLGMAGGIEEDTSGIDTDTKSFLTLFAPLGIEVTTGTSGKASWSLMYAPFDFSYPINLKLQQDDRPVELADIIAHGVYLSYGVKDWPVAVGLGVAKGKSIRTRNGDELRYMLFFAMDMPLFELY